MFLIPGVFSLIFVLQILNSDTSPGESIVRSFLIMSGITWIITEVLSLFGFITYGGIFFSWLGAVLVVISLIFLFYVKNTEVVRGRIRNLGDKISGLTWQNVLIIIGIAIILVLTLIIALYSPPNTFDSMTYHMARIVHWIQNRSVDFYATSIPRQNHSMPFAEYLIMNVQVMSQSDRYANLIQWTGFGVLMVTVSMITAQFRVSRTGKLFAALLVATLPIAILQSSSTQNDIITSVFCVSFAYYLLKIIKDGSWIDVIFAGLSFGLALLTKGTAYIFCAAIGSTIAIAGLVKKFKQDSMRLVWLLSVIILCGMIINSGYYARNLKLYSHPLSTETGRITIDRVSVTALYSNLIRNGSVHLAVPLPEVNQEISSLVSSHLSGIDPEQDTVFQGTDFKIKYLINEDESGNFIHFILLTISLVLLLVSWKRNAPNINVYVITLLLSIILFSGLFKWQPWGTRLELPIFSLGIPVIVYAVDRLRKSQTVILLLFIGLFIYSLPYLFLNRTRPLIPLFSDSSVLRSSKIKHFFSDRPNLYEDYKELISPFFQDSSVLRADRQKLYFSSNKRIYQDYLSVMEMVNELDEEYLGLHLGADDWEYPIWVLADRLDSRSKPGFIHVGVEDQSNILDRNPSIIPKYIISSDHKHLSEVMNKTYDILVDTESIDLLVGASD